MTDSVCRRRYFGFARPLVWLVLLASATDAVADDLLRALQYKASNRGIADWGHWGDRPDQYAAWSTHSNRLVPIYSFGLDLSSVAGENSPYRTAERLEKLYGKVPANSVNTAAAYFDQTGVYKLQQQAVAAGKKYIVLFIFDGLDWQTTWAAATYYAQSVQYRQGRGRGLLMQDYRGAPTDYGYFVTSPWSSEAEVDVDAQLVIDNSVGQPGGYDARRGGAVPWSNGVDLTYLTGRNGGHAYTDSAASATSIFSGIKTYNGAINVDPQGRQTTPLARRLQQQGFSVGVVTSVPVSHATPAAAYANNVSRNDYQDLTRDLLGLTSVAHREQPLPGVDVLLGTGWGVGSPTDQGQGRNYVPGNRYATRRTVESIDASAGGRYVVVRREPGTEGAPALAEAAKQAAKEKLRLFGMFGVATGHLPYCTGNEDYRPYVASQSERVKLRAGKPADQVDGLYLPEDVNENPTLAQMTTAALQVLGSHDKPFWLMIEAGDVDWAMHANQLDNTVGAIRSGQHALRALFRWIEENNAWQQTAVLVTADHGHLFVLRKPEALVE